MAHRPFHLTVVTPEGTAYDRDVTSVVMPGVDGAIGVWARHAPMIAALRAGVLHIQEAGDEVVEHIYALTGGFAEVSDNVMTMVADSCVHGDDIDIDRAKASLARAKERLRDAVRDKEIDVERAQAAKDRAEARLQAAYLRGP